jgi:plastocyanin
MKGIFVAAAAASAAAVFAGQAAASSTVTVTIRHQTVGCHAWAIGTGAYKATQAVTVKAGTSLRFVDNDVMPHQIIEVGGRKLALRGSHLSKMGANMAVKLLKPGTYVFGTKAGEDYTKGIVTKGEDNVLRLVVTVK